jgi:hypothetical protein
MSQLNELALKIAITQLGKEEVPRGSNWGEPVKTYLKSVGIGFPASWCMAFVYWCHNEAARQLGVPNPMAKTGGCMKQLALRKANIVTVPQAGDVFIMDHGHGLGHTGIVESTEGAFDHSVINTIEGNTNDTGSREGYEVCRRKRGIPNIKAFLRF